MFCDKLNEYMEKFECSGKELSKCSGISAATISRYRSGERTPKVNSEDMEKLCRGICEIAEKRGGEKISLKELAEEFAAAVSGEKFDYKAFQTKLNILLTVLSVNAADMSKALKYDSSHISRIRNGQRRPSKPENFAHDAAEYIAGFYDGENDKKLIAELIGEKGLVWENKHDYKKAVADWLISGETKEDAENPVSKFLEKLDEFDLNEYIRIIRFDELKVPSVPFQLPAARNYYGIEQMKNGEIDFLKTTALSKSKKDVFMCSDMQMDDMAKDVVFSKKYMFGLAAMLKKGLHLNVVHNVLRPFDELMLGLECWIPLYMTGQISPYYLKGEHNRVYCHFLNVSGAAALSGECISGHHKSGKYYFTNNKEELAYYSERAKCILEKASPLMEIYREETQGGLNAFLTADADTRGSRRSILSALPVYTMPDKFLSEFLDNHSVEDERREKIVQSVKMKKQRFEKILEQDSVTDIIPVLSREEFENFPIIFAESFGKEDIVYSYEDYAAHLEYTLEYAKNNPNYSAEKSQKNAFRNIGIIMHEGKWVLIAKSKAPAVQFVIRHPILREAIENLEFPIV